MSLLAIISREQSRHNLIKGFLLDSDDPAGYTSSRVSCLLGVWVVSPAVVVRASVENEGPAEDVVLAVQLDQAVHEVDLGGIAGIELDVAEVTDVAVFVIGVAMIMLERNVRYY